MNPFFFVLAFLAGTTANGQDTLMLANPSFEHAPDGAARLAGWRACNEPEEPAADALTGEFDQTIDPQDGASYLGLVVREDSTRESASQRLSRPLQAGFSYRFQVYLARSPEYWLTSAVTGVKINHTTPTRLRIWGGDQPCEGRELLAVSPLITRSEWVDHAFTLTPEEGDWQYIIFEADYAETILFPYNGNVLLDNGSDLVRVISRN